MDGEQPIKTDKPKGRPRHRGSKKKPAHSESGEIEQPKKITSRLKPPTVFSCIICAENADFYAVGICNHPICSICALRMRLIAKEKECAICKQRMDFMVVSMFRNAVQPFQSFGIFADTIAPGVRIDHASTLYFVNCAKHYSDLDVQRAVTCSLCQERFRSRKDLSKHLSNAHDVAMCQLCLDNLRLFVCEQELYTKNELKTHLNGRPGGAPGVHPQCHFCKSNVFDSMQLYAHMRDRHFSCYLCPAAHQHRFYKTIGDLELHFKSSHITCTICFSQSPVGARSYCVFRSNQEYREHMLSEHNVNLPPNSTNHLKVAFKFHSKNGGVAAPGGEMDGIDGSEPAYLDLFIEDRDREAPANDTDRPAAGKKGKAKAKAGKSAIVDPTTEPQIRHLVPEHMQIAGRVTGTGLFTRDASDDVFEQHSRDVQRAQAQRTGYAGRVAGSASGVRYNNMFDFPTLAAEGERAEAAPGSSSGSQALHPLSLVGQKGSKSTAKDGSNVDSAAVLKQKRNDAFAEALGIETRDTAASWHSATAIQEVTAQPIYPPSLLTWAVQNKAVLLKTEKRILTFMEDKYSASLQLPPMLRPVREGVHGIALYYGLNSHEYDHDPKRYISLVKTPSSKIPPCLLSTASLKPWVSVASVLQTGNSFVPGLYITLQETPKIPIFVSTIVHQVDGILSTICAEEYNGMSDYNGQSFSNAMKVLRPLRVQLFNASTVLLEFSSVPVASRICATLSANISQFGETVLVIPAFSSAAMQAPASRPVSNGASDASGFTTVRRKELKSAWDDDDTTPTVSAGNSQKRQDESAESEYVIVDRKISAENFVLSENTAEGEDEWENIDTKYLVFTEEKAAVAPRTIGLSEKSPAKASPPIVPFPRGKKLGEDHFVAPTVEDPAVVAKREEEWVKFLDEHKKKPIDTGSSEVAAYKPPFRRPQTVVSAPTSTAVLEQKNFPAISSGSTTEIRKNSAYQQRKPASAPKPQSARSQCNKLSFAMLQVEDSDSSDEDA